jgi:branched-chain amino acid aminotransferase
MHANILHNDSVVPATSAQLSPGQVGLMNGWGVFSTIRVFDGVLFAWERHWERMRRDAELLRVPFPTNRDAVQASLHALVDANQAGNATLRVCIVRNKGGAWEGPGQTREFDIVAFTTVLTDWQQGVKLTITPNARHAACEFAGSKILSWALNLTWFERARAEGFDETVLLNEHAQVAECTSANIFAAFGTEVFTPPVASGCLPGVTRDILLGESAKTGFSLQEKALTIDDLYRADSVFITSSTRELLAVAEIAGKPVGQAPDARLALQAAFSAYVDRYARDHARKMVLAAK